jgi:hypothetical protein
MVDLPAPGFPTIPITTLLLDFAINSFARASASSALLRIIGILDYP